MKYYNIALSLVIVNKDENLNIDGINFSNSVFVNIEIEGLSLFKSDRLEGSLLVFEELEKSMKGSGEFLIFTSVSGIADSGGWQYIEVKHNNSSVLWNFQRDNENFIFTFDKTLYIQEISKIKMELSKLDKTITLEPSYVIFPE